MSAASVILWHQFVTQHCIQCATIAHLFIFAQFQGPKYCLQSGLGKTHSGVDLSISWRGFLRLNQLKGVKCGALAVQDGDLNLRTHHKMKDSLIFGY